jgi:hypothetical protein
MSSAMIISLSSRRDFEPLVGNALCDAELHLTQEAGRYHSVLETNRPRAGNRSEIGTRPVKSIELADNDPRWGIVQPKASHCISGYGDSVAGSARGRVCDWGN